MGGQDNQALLGIPIAILQHLDVVWTLILLMVRFTTMFIVLPGIGAVSKTGSFKGPAIFVLAFAALLSSPRAAVPPDWGMFVAQVVSEAMLGFGLGLVPFLVISGVQTGAQIASTTMGLGMGTLIDPTSGQQNSDIAHIMGDLMVILFLVLGGHHAVIYAASGLGGQIIPGSYIISAGSIDLLVDQTAAIFRTGLLISAPVLVALLLTNFVMALISKAVPSVNIFMVSFPLTIGIGLILTVLALPDVSVFVERQYSKVEDQMLVVIQDAKLAR